MKTTWKAMALLLGCTLACASTWAWGRQPIKLIVPAPAGGTSDIVARVLGQQLSSDTGQPVIVENRAGAGGVIGMQALLAAPADGQTLLVGPSNLLAEIPHVIKMPFDPLKDVLPVASLARSGVVLVAAAGQGAQDFPTLLAQLKARKGQTSFASYSPGTVSHYAGLMLSDKAALDMQHVAYSGSPPALQAILGGQVDVMFDGMLTAVPLVRAGKLKAYAFSGPQRSRHLPQVPTTTELGYPDLQFKGWVGVMGSARLPADVLARIQAAIDKAARAPVVQQKLSDVGLEPEVVVDTPALQRETRALSERNAGIVKTYGITLN
ncbi:MFS transporter [Pseudorhodoferax aquiterrae]|uniref:MFS transporter n=1 Tax=Pseudorhodoferax aquiterrae TaxID=747304 RepID=A0ABQ3GFG1_9BURK|nr:tripartite tricarboxylate transporter substrate binding protein [Pseudorhodoferax aquiterrae]GHD02973.1 MFS transporter [Pseudorhodoferax aquiterrae]